MDQLRKSIHEAEIIRQSLEDLRQDKSKAGMIKYNQVLLEATDRQHNIYMRLRLMGDPESTRTADEMVYVAEQYMGKSKNVTFDSFIKKMKREITWQLNMLTAGKWDREEDRE
ncbi:MAG: hypothetical protein VXX91_03970 [Planctomycetota bacterium]|nr:hypothetical protein [Planctomycetota bacterium]